MRPASGVILEPGVISEILRIIPEVIGGLGPRASGAFPFSAFGEPIMNLPFGISTNSIVTPPPRSTDGFGASIFNSGGGLGLFGSGMGSGLLGSGSGFFDTGTGSCFFGSAG